MGVMMAATIGFAGVSSFHTDARHLPFPLTRHSVSKGSPVSIAPGCFP
jgi:hypothetical protein